MPLLPSHRDRTLCALWALPLALLLALVVGPILRDGMFIDGLAYTNIARSMYLGTGSFWAPSADGGATVFYGHPPLLFYLESRFFYLLGDHAYTEDAYNFTVLTTTVVLLYLIWVRVAGRRHRGLFFFPLVLFALNQEVQLRYPNAMLECGMTVILLLFTYGYLLLRDTRPRMAGLLTGVGACAAFLCKGPVGLFLLALPLLYAVVVENRFRLGALLWPLVGILASCGLLFALVPEVYGFLRAYLDVQVLTALRGQAIENVASSRFAFLRGLLQANVAGLVLSLLLLLVRRTPDSYRGPAPRNRPAYCFLLLGATAVLPLVVSTKQATYYQLPALPYFFIGLSLLLLPRLEGVVDYLATHRTARRVVLVGAGLGIVAGTYVACSMLGTTDRRDVRPLAQAARIAAAMDSLGADRYNLIVTGDRAAFDSALSYTVTGSLARWHDVYEDAERGAPVDLYIRTEHGTLPTGGGVVYSDGEVSLVRERRRR